MKVNNKHYPYPVLSSDSDDVLFSKFHSDLNKVDVLNNSYTLKFLCSTDDYDLLELIKARKACYAVKVDCNKTRNRELVKSFEEKFEVRKRASELDGKVKVSFSIIATEDIKEYKNVNFHQDYEDSTFHVYKGDVLALGDEFSFDAEKKIDPLRIIPSIFSIQPNMNKNASAIDVDTTDDKIVIKLNAENYYRFGHLRNTSDFQPVLSSMIIIPALTKVIDDIKTAVEDNGDNDGLLEMEELRWFRVIRSKFEDFNLDIFNSDTFTDSSLSLSQKIIGSPLNDALKNLEELDS